MFHMQDVFSPAKEPIKSCGHVFEKEHASTATTREIFVLNALAN